MSIAHEQAAPRTRGLLVSDLLAGTPERLPLRVALGMIAQIAQLIERTHQSGRLHLALGPAAVWCTTQGEIWLEWLPRQGPTHRSLPPELRRGNVPTIESDVYAIGALAYELLTGLSVSRAWAKAPLVRLSHVASPKYFNPEVPLEVDELIAWTLAREPYDRPHSAAEVAVVVEGFVAEGEWEGKLAALLEDPFYEPALRSLPITCERARQALAPPAPPPPDLVAVPCLPVGAPLDSAAQTELEDEEDDEQPRTSMPLVKIMIATSVAAIASLMFCLSAHVLADDEGGLAADVAQIADLAPPQPPAPTLHLVAPVKVEAEVEAPAPTAPPEVVAQVVKPRALVKAERAHAASRKLNHTKHRGR